MVVCLFAPFIAAAQTAPSPTPPKPALSGKASDSAFQFEEMLARGWPVISVLVLMSIVSLTIIAERIIVVSRAERDAATFLPKVLAAVKEEKSTREILDLCNEAGHPLSGILASVLAELGDREAMERAAQRALQLEVDKLERRTPTLGTIASTAPFVGLFGTVIGIIKAFQSIATTKGGGPEVVAGGVAEALITTAFGLFVAIPAVMGYNYHVHRVRRLALEVQVGVSEIIDAVRKRK
jgi:biopolymer transport protein ExbB/biopolymer transport protein TolQ